MKKNLLSTLFVALAFTSSIFAQVQVWKIDNMHSSVKFSVTHLVISEVDGSFKTYDGSISTTKSDFTDANIDFSIDVNSINTDMEKRDQHLKAEDFFNAEVYPKMSFKSISMKKIAKNVYELTGNLTIRNVMKKVKFKVIYGGTTKDGYGNTKVGFKATTTINRFDYGLKWNALTEAGGSTVGKDVTIVLNLQFAKEK